MVGQNSMPKVGQFSMPVHNGKRIEFRRISDGTLIKTLKYLNGPPHYYTLNDLTFTPDGEIIAAINVTIIVGWRVKDDKLAWELQIGSNVDCFKFSPDGKTLVSGDGGIIKLWNVSDGKLMDYSYQGCSDTCSISFLSNESFIAGGDWGLSMWNLKE